MTDESLEARRRALRDRFLAALSPEQRRALLGDNEAAVRREALSTVSGIRDDRVLDKLLELDIGRETLAALSLYPLVAMAWADGKVDRPERDVVLRAAEGFGMQPDELSYQLLDGWLAEAPDPELLTAWKRYVRGLADGLGDEWKQVLEDEILRLAEQVAAATGGFLALDKISSREYAVLRELRETFA